MTTEERQSIFGRAVGRVLAHELFHVFTGTTRHRSGVAKAEFTRRELLADPFQFKPEESHSMRVALRAARLIYNRHRTAASPVSGRFLFLESGCAKCHGESGAGTRGAPALRPLHSIDPKTLAGKLTNELETMYRRLKSRPPSIPALDDDEIADLASFLNSLE